MTRPDVPDKGGARGKGRDPSEYDPDLATAKAIEWFIKYLSGHLSDTSDKFKGFEAKWQSLNKVTGLDCSLRLNCYKNYRIVSPDRDRMSRNEAVRLLSRPKIIVHGSDLLSPDIQEPGLIDTIITGAKRMVGLQPAEERRDVSGPRY